MQILELVNRPYPIQFKLSQKLASAFGFGAFVFLFLYLFAPFGLDTLQHGLLLVTASYGAATTVVMVVLNIFIPVLAPQLFDEEKWTVLREIVWTGINVFFIALTNFWLSVRLGTSAYSWHSFQFFVGYTMAIGVFPVTISVLAAELRLRKKFETGSLPLNKELELPSKNLASAVTSIAISSENNKEKLEIEVSALLYIRAAENYVDVFWLNKSAVSKTVLRNSLKNVSENLTATAPSLLRCHKSFLVNLAHVKHISGNAQGYKLHLAHTDFLVPVSRQLNDQLPQLLAEGH